MRWKSLDQLKRTEPERIELASLPAEIVMDRYAHDKAFQINELIRNTHGHSLEWYGFTLGRREAPDLVADIGLPTNDVNLTDYTGLSPERVAEFQQSLPADLIINGWIHSHGALMVHDFSRTDQANHQVVLDFVAAGVKRAVAKQQIVVRDLVLLQRGRTSDNDLRAGSVAIITDAPIGSAEILETIYGSFCYAILIGDEGWHRQQIHYREIGVLTGRSKDSSREGRLILVDRGRCLTGEIILDLEWQVRQKIRPNLNPPVETLERL